MKKGIVLLFVVFVLSSCASLNTSWWYDPAPERSKGIAIRNVPGYTAPTTVPKRIECITRTTTYGITKTTCR